MRYRENREIGTDILERLVPQNHDAAEVPWLLWEEKSRQTCSCCFCGYGELSDKNFSVVIDTLLEFGAHLFEGRMV